MRILLVEDEKRMAQALCEILRLEKYDVDHYDNGTDGLAAIESNIYDIVILDVMLPGMDGYEVAKKTRLKGITTPILMLTARAELDDKVAGVKPANMLTPIFSFCGFSAQSDKITDIIMRNICSFAKRLNQKNASILSDVGI